MAAKIISLCNKLTKTCLVNQTYQQHCLRCLSNNISKTPLPSCSFSILSRLYSTKEISEVEPEVNDPDVLYKRIFIEVKGHDPEVINSYQKFTTLAANELDIQIASITTPPRDITRYTQLKSVHIFKKHRVQYEARTHFRVIELKYLTGSTADTYLEYIQRHLPEGMAMKVTKNRLEAIPQHIKDAIIENQPTFEKD
ncbi:hypothetical protein SNE40_010500 [Patella caerulea]|uniref:Small ribosomal subunit protein uS10m n=1 Tax=Patella caerulea TaxID=87958 RepID=A0AAN8JQK9_PATCE